MVYRGPYFSRGPRSRRAAQRGVGVLDVLLASAIIVFSLVTAAMLFSSQVQDAVRVQAGTASQQLESLVRVTIFNRVRGYLEAVSAAGCADGGQLAALMNEGTAEGYALTYLDGPNAVGPLQTQFTTLLHATTTMDSGVYQKALGRCVAPTSLSGVVGDSGVYFCLKVTNALGTSASDDIRAMQPLFAEFRFLPIDTATGNTISCANTPTLTSYLSNSLGPPPWRQQVIGNLYYSFYWATPGPAHPVFSTYTSMYASSW